MWSRIRQRGLFLIGGKKNYTTRYVETCALMSKNNEQKHCNKISVSVFSFLLVLSGD